MTVTMTVTVPSSGAEYTTAPNDTVTSGSSSSPMFTMVSSVVPSLTLSGSVPNSQPHALVVVVHRILCGREGKRLGGLAELKVTLGGTPE